jgi:hypothetical protein
MLVGKMLVGEQPGARLGSLGLLFSGGVVALGLQGGPVADRGLAVHAAGVIRTGMFWSLGDPQRKMTGVNIQVPHTPSVATRPVSSGSNAPETRSLETTSRSDEAIAIRATAFDQRKMGLRQFPPNNSRGQSRASKIFPPSCPERSGAMTACRGHRDIRSSVAPRQASSPRYWAAAGPASHQRSQCL